MQVGIILIISSIIMGCTASPSGNKIIKYLALGDSYTCCEGAKPEEAWPLLIANQIKEKRIDMQVTNPAHTGWTTQNLIDRELPLLERVKPDIVTLLIGVNDWVQGVDSAIFHKNLNYIIDRAEESLANKKNLILITIPDFGVTPTGAMYSGGRDISKGIDAFNSIIKHEAAKRGLPCVDIYPATQKMKGDASLIAADGLHPSAKEYAIWEKMIYPEVERIVK